MDLLAASYAYVGQMKKAEALLKQSFAIPSNLAADVMRQLIATGSVKRGTLGVQAQDLTQQIANMLGTKLTQGAVVTQVRDGSPADTGGIKPGDDFEVVDKQPFDGPLFANFNGEVHVIGGALARAMRVEQGGAA